MSVPMALVDYIPVVLFLIANISLQRDLYNKMSKGCYAVFCTGGIMIFIAGAYKATWKLLYALNVCDFQSLSQCFFPMQATGFALCAAGIIAMLCHKQGETKTLAVAAPAVFSGTMIFVTMMCLGIIGIGTSLSVLSAKLKKKGLIALFVFTIIGLLCMGYLSTKDFELPIYNWLAEIINVIAMSCQLIGVRLLHKAGLADLEL